ncbi:MAG: hypothetical protein BAA04_11230 [Firmicutes bacterium ZCTH02-B6]|nr:MAG: hypothetical protein BAA04_11230 [Firmicutes bacterium ZCTH02-B6]
MELVEDRAPSLMRETAARLTALGGYRRYLVGVPAEDGWVPLSRLAEPALAEQWFSQAAEGLGDRPSAGAFLTRIYIDAVVLTWLYPVLVDGRLPLSPMAQVAIHRHPQGWVDAVAVNGGGLAVLAGDPGLASLPAPLERGAGPAPAAIPRQAEPLLVFAGQDELFDALTERLLQLQPLLAVVREVSGRGWPALWGEVADIISGSALWLARLLGRDRWAAWGDAEAIIDRLAAREPRLKVRPRPFPVQWSSGEDLFTVRGTCCLYYRFHKHNPEHRYCESCPLRSDEWRLERLRAQLEADAAREGAAAG